MDAECEMFLQNIAAMLLKKMGKIWTDVAKEDGQA